MSETSAPRAMPPRFVICRLQQDATCLCCPVCGFGYVHPEQVAVDQGSMRSVVTRESTTVTTSDGPNGRRGSSVALRFWCEQGHGFEYRYEFHKGQLLCELSWWPLPDSQPSEELWRN